MRARRLGGLLLAALLLAGGRAVAQPAASPDGPPAQSGDLILLLALDNDGDLGRGVGLRLEDYITKAVRVSPVRGAPGTLANVVVVRLPPGDLKLDPDEDMDRVRALIASRNAEAALVGGVSRYDDAVVTRATLSVPAPRREGPDRWAVRFGGQTLELPLAYGAYRFETVTVPYQRLAPTTTQSFAGQVAAVTSATTKRLGLNQLPLLKRLYASEATITEDGVASFAGGVMAYHAGDFIQAERLFARAKALASPGSSIRADAAVLHLAAAARAAPLRRQQSGRKPIAPWSGSLRKVNHLGDAVLKEFPWSVDARKVLATFHFEAAINAPDSAFRGTATRIFERSQAKHYLKAVDKLREDQDEWSKQAHRLSEALG
jgi:hypothetical protein